MESDVIILFGGSSSERLVSVASAQNVSEQLPQATCWFLQTDGTVWLVDRPALRAHEHPFERDFVPSGSPRFPSLDAALDSAEAQGRTFFLALHGGEGENGVIQRKFEQRKLAFTGSSSRASADAFDKAKTRLMASAKGARVAQARTLAPMGVAELKAELTAMLTEHPRWVLKPQADGSSHGLVHLQGPQQLDSAVDVVIASRTLYLAEVFIEGRELTVGVVNGESDLTALPVSEVRFLPGRAFDYAGKYLGRGTEEITPAAITFEQRQAAQALAILTHLALNCFGYSRTDMILTDDGPVLLEINTLPGMTKASFIPQQLNAAGRPVKDFLEEQLRLARARRDGRH